MPNNRDVSQLGISVSPQQITLITDREHLRLLALFHKIFASLIGLAACMFLLYVFMGMMILLLPSGSGTAPPSAIGFILMLIGGIAVAVTAGYSALMVYSGKQIQQRKRRGFSIVMASLACMNFPLGTILGVSTIMVLTRASVRELYEHANEPEPAAKIPELPLIEDHDEAVWSELERQSKQAEQKEESAQS